MCSTRSRFDSINFHRLFKLFLCKALTVIALTLFIPFVACRELYLRYALQLYLALCPLKLLSFPCKFLTLSRILPTISDSLLLSNDFKPHNISRASCTALEPLLMASLKSLSIKTTGFVWIKRLCLY